MPKARINTQLLGKTKDDLLRVQMTEAEVVRRQYLSHLKEPMVGDTLLIGS